MPRFWRLTGKSHRPSTTRVQTFRMWIIACGIAIISSLLYSSGFLQSTLEMSNHKTQQHDCTDKIPKAAFYASRLTNSTFLIKEYDDVYSEHPNIYAKVVSAANSILIVDTGCGGVSNDSTIEITNLREFIENVAVDQNDGKPLNEHGRMKYIVVSTHCHYDHILGNEHFSKDSPILASSYDPEFISPDMLPEHSLCNHLGIDVPTYVPQLVPHLYQLVSDNDEVPLGVTVLHTPGHTPDELALYDEREMMLFVGDTLYEIEPIIFPKEGSIVAWFDSVDYLVKFVKERNVASDEKKVMLNAGHGRVLQPALDVLQASKEFLLDVVEGRIDAHERSENRGEIRVRYDQPSGHFALVCPERLILEARAMRRV
ncbi:beta-lactamase-like protein [Cyathus striatus]|nr:beta-lactamase-like protein [Cyathus striatus]